MLDLHRPPDQLGERRARHPAEHPAGKAGMRLDVDLGISGPVGSTRAHR